MEKEKEKAIETIRNRAKKELPDGAEFKFTCYTDNMLLYNLDYNEKHHEITIICDGTLSNTEPITEILNATGIEFISYAIYTLKDDRPINQLNGVNHIALYSSKLR